MGFSIYATLKAGAHRGDVCFTAETVTLGHPPGPRTTSDPPATATTPTTPSKPPEPDSCNAASKNTRFEGQSCSSPKIVCCPNDGSLRCEDDVCVQPLK